MTRAQAVLWSICILFGILCALGLFVGAVALAGAVMGLG